MWILMRTQPKAQPSNDLPTSKAQTHLMLTLAGRGPLTVRLLDCCFVPDERENRRAAWLMAICPTFKASTVF